MRGWPLRATLGLGSVVTLVWSASPAVAHTELVSSRPAPQAVLASAPSSVAVRFSKAVEAGPAAIQVFDPSKRLLGAGPVTTADQGHSVSVPLMPDVGEGVFTVSWRVVADDGHPLQGAFTFRVGTTRAGGLEVGRTTAATVNAADQRTTAGVLGILLTGSRWSAYAGLLLLVGTAVFLRTTWPAGWTDRRSTWLLWAGWAAAVIGTLSALLLQGPSATGRSVTTAFDGDLLREVSETRLGKAWLLRLALLGIVAALLVWRRRTRTAQSNPTSLVWALISVALLTTAAVSGHASTGDFAALAVATDVVHLTALAIWLGGLVVLIAAVLRASVVDRDAVARFSRVAFGCVVVVVVTGAIQGWREVGSTGALTNTRYGTLLIAKIAIFVVLIGAAALSRRALQNRTRSSTAAILRWSVGAEIAVATVVLVVASVLVATPPARNSYARAFRVELRAEPLRLALVVAPAKVGPVQLDLRTRTRDGDDAPVTFMTVELRLPKDQIGPLFVRMERLSASHYRAKDVELPLPGRWQLSAHLFLGGGAKIRSTTSFGVT